MKADPTLSDTNARAAWTAADPAGLLISQWEVDNSVFSKDTGETHLLGELPVFVLQCLSVTPRDLAWISEHGAQGCETENDPAWQRKIASTLAALEDLELIRRLPGT